MVIHRLLLFIGYVEKVWMRANKIVNYVYKINFILVSKIKMINGDVWKHMLTRY